MKKKNKKNKKLYFKNKKNNKIIYKLIRMRASNLKNHLKQIKKI